MGYVPPPPPAYDFGDYREPSFSSLIDDAREILELRPLLPLYEVGGAEAVSKLFPMEPPPRPRLDPANDPNTSVR